METVDKRVLEVLKACPCARFDDMILVLEYYNRYSNAHFPVGKETFEKVMRNYKKYGLPCFESIRRARQRIQSVLPELSRNVQKETSQVVIKIFMGDDRNE